ncbi:MAG: winged helix-turn-helix transcriptional regulator [Bacillota bacterium]
MTQEMENTVNVNFGCPVAKTVGVIGGKWKGVILYHLTTGPRRYNEIRRTLPNITQRMLTLQLRELERDGIVHREIYNENPPRVEYSLTPLGDTLRPLLDFMRDWGVFYVEQTCGPVAANSKCGESSCWSGK